MQYKEDGMITPISLKILPYNKIMINHVNKTYLNLESSV
jgi:hypothetical protein